MAQILINVDQPGDKINKTFTDTFLSIWGAVFTKGFTLDKTLYPTPGY